MTHFVTKKQDGSIAVTHLSPEYIAKCAKDGISEADALEAHISELKGRGAIEATDEVVGRSEIQLPADREFRGAWRWLTADPKVDICPHAAVECTKNRLRAERAPKFLELDIAFQRAIEEGNTTKQAEVAAKKQTLRDATSQVPIVPAGMVAADDAFLSSLRSVELPQV